MMYIVSILTVDNRLGFYTGNSFDTSKIKSKQYKNKGIATIQGNKLLKVKGIKRVIVIPYSIPPKTIRSHLVNNTSLNLTGKSKKRVVKKKRVIKKKNPIAGSKKRRVKKAANLYENFTGHKADYSEVVNLPQHDTGLLVGRCIGIMYETVRDGQTEQYRHEFKRQSQPDFIVSHDGQQIYLIGGNYLFKDSGINDI